jgi:hypothetical protein
MRGGGGLGDVQDRLARRPKKAFERRNIFQRIDENAHALADKLEACP